MLSENLRFNLPPPVSNVPFANSRSLLKSEEIEIAIFCVQNNWDQISLKQHLKEYYGVQYSSADLCIYISRWKGFCTDLDKPVIWTASSLSDNGISSINRQKLYTISSIMKKLAQMNGEKVIYPTYRSIRWLDYMVDCHSSCFSGLLDLTTIADQYAMREIYSNYTGVLLDVDDIDTWLINRPWENMSNYRNYVDLVNNQVVEAIRWPESMPINLTISSLTKVFSGVGRASLLNPLLGKCPIWLRYFRPSQILEILFPDNDTKLQSLKVLTSSRARYDDQLLPYDESRVEEIMISLANREPKYIDGFRI